MCTDFNHSTTLSVARETKALAEHLLVFASLFLTLVIPSEPEWVRTYTRRREYEKALALRHTLLSARVASAVPVPVTPPASSSPSSLSSPSPSVAPVTRSTCTPLPEREHSEGGADNTGKRRGDDAKAATTAVPPTTATISSTGGGGGGGVGGPRRMSLRRRRRKANY